MGRTHDPPLLSPSSERRRKIAKRVETQIDRQTEFKTSQEVLDVVSKLGNQSGPGNQSKPGSQDEPINQSQPINQEQLVDQIQSEDQDQPEDQYRRAGIYDDWDEIEQDSRLQRLQAHDVRMRRKGWAQGKKDEESFRKNYRFDNKSLFYNKVYKTPMNSVVSRGPNSFWDTNYWLIEHRSTRKKILELKKGQSKNSKLREVVRRNQRNAVQSNRFLQGYNEELGSGWKGVKILGKGGQGIVGLWEYTGPDPHEWGKKVVIKMTLRHPFNHEREIMMLMGNDDPQVNHAAKLLYPTVIEHRRRDRDIEKLVLEFCEGGDLYTLIVNQKKKGWYFTEHTLWYIFACLVKGLNIMDHGDENPERKLDSRPPICHFDLKPANILIGKRDDGEHQQYPILKIADYGIAEVIHPTDYIDIYRGRGTRGYLLPEQFSKRWAYDDAATSGHVNVWGTHSNIWSVGLVMYMLATLSGPPRPKGFRCALIGNQFTYGYKLKAMELSTPLKRLIWRCLCDKPKERPSLKYLNQEIQSTVGVIKEQMRGYSLGLEFDEPQDPNVKAEGEEKGTGKGTGKGKDGQILIEDPGQSTAKPDQSAVKGMRKGKDVQDPSQHHAPTPGTLKRGIQDAPILIRGGAAVLRAIVVTFCVVPKYLPLFQQVPIWFTASIDTTVQQLKTALRVEAGLELPEEKQFLYHRTSSKRDPTDAPDILLRNSHAMLTSGYGVGNGTRLELWTSIEDHDLHEPDETDFDVV